jgi:pimeloyl-ACP methyl ester carboxylesterase
MDESQFSEPTRRWLDSGRHLELEGKRIFVHERGSGPAVLLLHGFPTSGYDWRGVIDGLAGDYRCVALDFPGYGLSEKPAAYSYSLFQQTDVVGALTKALDISEAHVVSHDVGTSVHTELLAREQEGRLAFRITSSTFLNGSMLQDIATITPYQKLLASNETLPQAIAISDNMTVNYIDGLKSVMKKPECLTDDDMTAMNDLVRYQEGNRRLPALSLYMRERYIHRERWIGALKKASPIQFIWADGDPVANVEMGRTLAKEVPQAKYTELTGLGHFLLMEDPATVAKRGKAHSRVHRCVSRVLRSGPRVTKIDGATKRGTTGLGANPRRTPLPPFTSRVHEARPRGRRRRFRSAWRDWSPPARLLRFSRRSDARDPLHLPRRRHRPRPAPPLTSDF